MNQEPKEKFNASYDGIIENDNPMPGWWLSIFYGCVAFAVVYFAYYQLGPGKTLVQSFEESAQTRKVEIMTREANQKDPTDTELNALLAKNEIKNTGKEVFNAKCAVCHGAQGQGGIGPNMTDSAWIHGGAPYTIYATIKNGVLDKGMPAWKGVITNDELQGVTVYVMSLKGSNPPNPKAPQGTEEK